MNSSKDEKKPFCKKCKLAYSNKKKLDVSVDNVSIAPSEAPSDYDTRKKIKYGNPAQAAWGMFSEYCNNSTIHGIKYLGEQKRPVWERLFWICVFVISIYACSQLIMNIYRKWDEKPVIVNFAEKSTSVWEIPFPAVTICSETKARKDIFDFTKAYHILQNGQNLTEEDDFFMESFTQVCNPYIRYGKPIADGNITSALEVAAVFFNQTYLVCKWRDLIAPCIALFRKVITEEGICYSFNNLAPNEMFRPESVYYDDKYSQENPKSSWKLEDGYDRDAGEDPFPQRVMGAGEYTGLSLLALGLDLDYDHICRGPFKGFKILLHTPGEMPRISRQFFRIPYGQEVLLSIKPNMMTTSTGLQHYSPERRQCYFNHERYLRYFRVYTQTNCESECLANYTLKVCGCVKFSMPRNISAPICGAGSITCFEKAEYEFPKFEFQMSLQKEEVTDPGVTKCNCLPACTSIAYDAEISQGDFDFWSMWTALNFSNVEDDTTMQMARVSISFKENQFITSKRSELYGSTDFLANCGGLLGLFMGVSILSLVELLYFCTVRLVSNLNPLTGKIVKLTKTSREFFFCLITHYKTLIRNQHVIFMFILVTT